MKIAGAIKADPPIFTDYTDYALGQDVEFFS
jgi:hypothetical protein